MRLPRDVRVHDLSTGSTHRLSLRTSPHLSLTPFRDGRLLGLGCRTIFTPQPATRSALSLQHGEASDDHPIHDEGCASTSEAAGRVVIPVTSLREGYLQPEGCHEPPTASLGLSTAPNYPACSFASAMSFINVSTSTGSAAPSGYSACTRLASSAAASAAAMSPTPR